MQAIFNYYLDRPFLPQPFVNQNSILLIDGTWFNKENCLIVYYDIVLNEIQYWSYTKSEKSDEIIKNLEYLKSKNVICVAAVTDGGLGLNCALKRVYPAIPIQRCLVHLQRLSLSWLTRNQKTQAGKKLRLICLAINKVKDKEQKKIWIELFTDWNKQFEHFLKEKSFNPFNNRWWYTHKYLRKVRRLLLNALPDMFHYLDNPKIPKDTNRLEGGIFSPLKDIYRTHRGLSKKKRANFFHWYFHLKYLSKKLNSPTKFYH